MERAYMFLYVLSFIIIKHYEELIFLFVIASIGFMYE